MSTLAGALWEELDLRREEESQTRFANNMASVAGVHVPTVIASRRTVMVSEWVDGTPLNALPSESPVLRNAVRRMRDAYCKSMYEDGYFHADCHGGNLLSTPGDPRGELCILDCGLMVEIEDHDADALLRLTLHLAQRDFTKVNDDKKS